MTAAASLLEEVTRARVLALEVACEMHALAGGYVWDQIEEAAYREQQQRLASWSAHGQWWRRTRAGRQNSARYQRERQARLKTIVVAIAACKGCGKLFERTAYHVAYGKGRVCSSACRGKCRRNVRRVQLEPGGEALPLARWAERAGLQLSTVCRRLYAGWSLHEALRAPLRPCGRPRGDLS